LRPGLAPLSPMGSAGLSACPQASRHPTKPTIDGRYRHAAAGIRSSQSRRPGASVEARRSSLAKVAERMARSLIECSTTELIAVQAMQDLNPRHLVDKTSGCAQHTNAEPAPALRNRWKFPLRALPAYSIALPSLSSPIGSGLNMAKVLRTEQTSLLERFPRAIPGWQNLPRDSAPLRAMSQRLGSVAGGSR